MSKKKSFHYQHLKKKWLKRQEEIEKQILEKHKESFDWLSQNSKQLAVGSLAGLFLLANPITAQLPSTMSAVINPQTTTNIDQNTFVIYDLYNVLPKEVRPLTSDEETKIAQILTRDFKIEVSPQIGGKRLNTTYGLIGQEQHLARFPGDNIYVHFANSSDAQDYWNYGMAPGLGAWGYFADSQSAMTKEQSDREKYYIAVQTFLAPGFDQNSKQYLDFFKYRKMLVVNPQNGKAVVAVIADSGPAVWTGKQLGGSPEVMKYLQRYDGKQIGPVLYFFIEDPDNKIPLGPVSL